MAQRIHPKIPVIKIIYVIIPAIKYKTFLKKTIGGVESTC